MFAISQLQTIFEMEMHILRAKRKKEWKKGTHGIVEDLQKTRK